MVRNPDPIISLYFGLEHFGLVPKLSQLMMAQREDIPKNWEESIEQAKTGWVCLFGGCPVCSAFTCTFPAPALQSWQWRPQVPLMPSLEVQSPANDGIKPRWQGTVCDYVCPGTIKVCWALRRASSHAHVCGLQNENRDSGAVRWGGGGPRTTRATVRPCLCVWGGRW